MTVDWGDVSILIGQALSGIDGDGELIVDNLPTLKRALVKRYHWWHDDLNDEARCVAACLSFVGLTDVYRCPYDTLESIMDPILRVMNGTRVNQGRPRAIDGGFGFLMATDLNLKDTLCSLAARAYNTTNWRNPASRQALETVLAACVAEQERLDTDEIKTLVADYVNPVIR